MSDVIVVVCNLLTYFLHNHYALSKYFCKHFYILLLQNFTISIKKTLFYFLLLAYISNYSWHLRHYEGMQWSNSKHPFVTQSKTCYKSFANAQDDVQFVILSRRRRISYKPCLRYFANAQYDRMMKVVLWIASKSKIFRNNGLNLQILQIGYSHLMKRWKNSCCLSGSEFTSFRLNLVTVLGRRCFSFLSNILSFFIAKKRKNIWCRVWGCINPNINKSALTDSVSSTEWRVFICHHER